MLHLAADRRYHMHELLRQFGAEQLAPDDAQVVRRLHSIYFSNFVQEREPYKMTERQTEAFADVERELDNIQYGWSWAATHLTDPTEAEAAMQSLCGYAPLLSRFFRRGGRFHEGVELFELLTDSVAEWTSTQAVEALDAARQRLLSTVWTSEARVRYALGQFERVRQLTDDAARLARRLADAALLTEALTNLALAHVRLGNYDRADECLHEALTCSRTLDDPLERVNPLTVLGMVAYHQNHLEAAAEYFEECLAIFRTTGWLPGVANLLSNLGTTHMRLENYDRAQALFAEAHAMAQTDADEFMLAIITNNLGCIANVQGDFSRAMDHFTDSVATFRTLDERRWTAESLTGLARTYIGLEQYATAQRHLYEALEIAWSVNSTADVLNSLAALAEIAAQRNAWARAIRIASVATHHPTTPEPTARRCQKLLDDAQGRVEETEWQRAAARKPADDMDVELDALVSTLLANQTP